ncbi:MAG: MFS transporter [Pseudomonadota bacterium]
MRIRLPFIFIIVTVMIDAIGIGIILPVMPDLIQELTGGTVSEAAVWGGYLAFSYAAMQFVFSPILGGLSDRYGRRPVLLISLLFLGLDYIVLALAGTIWLLFIARMLAGITGATYAAAAAYIADISVPEERAANFGIIGAAFGAGFVIGPVLGGLLGTVGPRAPFVAAAALALGNAVLGYFILPETLSAEKRRRFSWRRANPLGALAQMRLLPGLSGLVLVFLIFEITQGVYPSIWSYYTIERFGWGIGTVGLSLTVYGACLVVAEGWLIRKIVPLVGAGRTVLVMLWLNVVIFGSLLMIRETWQIFAFLPFAAISGIVSPALAGLMSNRVGDDAQGELQGVLGSCGALAAIIAPVMATATFRAFTAPGAMVYLPPAPFAVCGLLILVAIVFFVRGWRAEAARRRPRPGA